MPSLGPRLIAYGFVGVFCIAGPLFLLIALDSALHRVAFIHSALRADGTVIEMRPVRSTRTGAGTYVPVFRFTANDGRMHIIISDVSVPSSAFTLGDRVRVLYLQSNPETARIDAFSPLWLSSLIPGIVGAAFSFFPALILVNRMRRRASSGLTLPPTR
jgi:hypothetical protein